MDLLKFNFHCPSCDQKLNSNDEIILVTHRSSGEIGNIFLSVAVGDYGYRHEPKTIFFPGEVIEFFCPNCDVNLASEEHQNFALLNMDVGNNIKFEVIFSRESGKRKTYLITEDGIETYHG